MRAPILIGAAAAGLVLVGAASARAQGQIVIVNINAPGVGFNDPAPAAPVGGNTGTTLGEQRLIVFEHAANLWEAALNPRTDIRVRAQFSNLAAGVLGSAGPVYVSRNFSGAELPNTWYHAALANHLSGTDQDPANDEISANFSTNFVFYLGLDNNEPAGTSDLLAVVLHELGHGLGFSNVVNEATGSQVAGGPDTYSQYTLDVTTDKIWNDMTNLERQSSAINIYNVSWNGRHVNDDVPNVLQPGVPYLGVNSPGGLGPFLFGAASFGSPIPPTGLTGDVVLADDGAAPNTDACTPLVPVTPGSIVLLDRGTCVFTVKVKNAQDAGAAGVIVADNAAGTPPAGLGGADPTITIPSGRVTLADGNTLKANLAGGLNVTFGLDTSILAGTDRTRGLMLVATFDPVLTGSSISHFDGIAYPNQLMEPAINSDLTSSLVPPQDLTLRLMTDIGWFSDGDGVPDGRDSCLGSNIAATVVIDNCDSLAPNVVLSDGCSLSDLIETCTDDAHPRVFERCVGRIVREAESDDEITAAERRAIQRCAGQTHP